MPHGARRPSPAARLVPLLAGALVAFAGNSVLCRAALGAGHADPATFTLVRIACGAAVLLALTRGRGGAREAAAPGTARRAVALFAYAALFSWAYGRVGAGVGALALFACVQGTMIAGAWARGEGPRGGQWLGVIAALGGLAALTLPGASAPDPMGLAAMAGSGVAWGAYSLLGRRVTAPLRATARAFAGAVPLALAGAGVGLATGGLACDATGAALAAASGALTSALGYAAWYSVLPRLGTTRAAAAQLAVPVLTAFAGSLWLGEAPSARLAGASAAILGGIALASLSGRGRAAPEPPS